jgi:hypothetical protein
MSCRLSQRSQRSSRSSSPVDNVVLTRKARPSSTSARGCRTCVDRSYCLGHAVRARACVESRRSDGRTRDFPGVMRSATEAEIVNFEARELEMCLLKCRAQAEVLARSSAALRCALAHHETRRVRGLPAETRKAGRPVDARHGHD